eukprot:TRINITY_DN37549_c0_g1_i1.p1 TRINITY_DN37549_c0_g1~~TRINITY_DN37549_c0_g1_i1.p1  ORF type:complete len:486 (+),score=86.26 TRINITY_DN37549_c0_g1_i1:42-1499(+)
MPRATLLFAKAAALGTEADRAGGPQAPLIENLPSNKKEVAGPGLARSICQSCGDAATLFASDSLQRRGRWPRLRRQRFSVRAKADSRVKCRYKKKSEAELSRITDAVQAAKESGEPVCMTLAAEDALERVAKLDGSFCALDVEEVVQLDNETKEDMQRLCEVLRPRGHVSLGLLTHWCLWEKLGLPQELRIRSDLLPVVTLDNPTAAEVSRYVQRNQPLILKNAINADGFPPLADFKDFNYLHERCGSRPIKVKAEAFVDKEGRQLFVSDPAAELTFSDFLDRLHASERYSVHPSAYMGKVKLNDMLPEMVEDIEDCTMGPMQKYGSCFGKNTKGSHIYFGAGHNTTAIHCDPSENLLVVISGKKTFDLYPPTDADCLYVIKGPNFLNSPLPPFIDPASMPADFAEQYPLYCHAQPQRVELRPGDMLYLPIFWWHAVTGGEESNMIINWWCEMTPDKHDTSRGANGGAVAVAEAIQELMVLPTTS